jgi:hypothetical protein
MRHKMKRMGAVGLCLAAILVAGMALAGTASAEGLLWLVCLPGNNLTRYTNSRCLTAGGTGNPRWQSLGLLPGQRVTIDILSLTRLLRDIKAPGEPEVQCFEKGSRGEGEFEAGGKGKITIDEYENPKENCIGKKDCEAKGVEAVRGVHLPWDVELIETEGKMETKILAHSGGGEPGWEVKCKTEILGSQTDICESEGKEKSEQDIAENRRSPLTGELLVFTTLLGLHKSKCSLGGAEAGLLHGYEAELLTGGAWSINR